MYTVHVFGKEGCAKCGILKNRIIQLLQDPKYSNFNMEYTDIKTPEGLVEFCMEEVLNPNRIPSFLIKHSGKIRRNPEDKLTNSSQIMKWLGLQTDYDSGGFLTPKMISAELDSVS